MKANCRVMSAYIYIYIYITNNLYILSSSISITHRLMHFLTWYLTPPPQLREQELQSLHLSQRGYGYTFFFAFFEVDEVASCGGLGDENTSSTFGVCLVVATLPLSKRSLVVTLGNVVVSRTDLKVDVLGLVAFNDIIVVDFNTLSSDLLDILLAVSFSKYSSLLFGFCLGDDRSFLVCHKFASS